MNGFEIFLLVVVFLFFIALVILLLSFSAQKKSFNQFISDANTSREKLSSLLKEYHEENKNDYERAQTSQREEISERIKDFNNSFNNGVKLFSESQKTQLESLEKTQGERLHSLEQIQNQRLESMEKTQSEMVKTTQDRLENIRKTVEEKLDKTLADRLGQSFNTVSKQLEGVQKGLGEMRTLADDVGGLKKVLSNVKLRGGVGELQLKMLLEQYLAPGQYQANVKTKTSDKSSKAVVEFAIKFPGPDGKTVWLPIDSKFPQDKYEQLLSAYEIAEKEQIDKAKKDLNTAIKLNAKDISSKYIDVPNTTRFAIMFLPFEGLYAEVVRDNDLLTEIQREYNITIAGPTNLAAILTSFQLGFQTLAIQKRGDEVWKTLGSVKTEFEKFGGILQKAKGKIEGGLTELDMLLSTRTNQINRALRDVEANEQSLLPTDDITDENGLPI